MTDFFRPAGVGKWSAVTSWIPRLGRAAPGVLNGVSLRILVPVHGKRKKMIAGLTEKDVRGALQDVLAKRLQRVAEGAAPWSCVFSRLADIHDAEHDDLVRVPDPGSMCARTCSQRTCRSMKTRLCGRAPLSQSAHPRRYLQKSSDRFRCTNAPMFCH